VPLCVWPFLDLTRAAEISISHTVNRLKVLKIKQSFLIINVPIKVGTCKASGFESVVLRFESHGPIRKFSNRSCLPIARRSQTTEA